MRRLIGAPLLLLLAGPVLALSIVWPNASTNGASETILRNDIIAEHLSACGTTLGVSGQLTWLARYRATDMVLLNYFAHRSPTSGKTVLDLLTTAHIAWRTAGEIIAWNSYTDDISADTAFRQFMGSSEHRAIIDTCVYRTVGVGDYKVGTKHMYAVVFIG